MSYDSTQRSGVQKEKGTTAVSVAPSTLVLAGGRKRAPIATREARSDSRALARQVVERVVIGLAISRLLIEPLGQSPSGLEVRAQLLHQAVDLGIGVLGETKVVQGGIDLTGDGRPETFTQCATSEGVSFRVWSGTPYQGLPLWSGYYYLGYDVEANCPP